MRLTTPRIQPMTDAEMGPEQQEALRDFGPGPLLNIFRTLARAPKALARPSASSNDSDNQRTQPG